MRLWELIKNFLITIFVIVFGGAIIVAVPILGTILGIAFGVITIWFFVTHWDKPMSGDDGKNY
jgi:hypothetical protein